MACFIKSFCQQSCCWLVLQVWCSSNVKSLRNMGQWPQRGFMTSSARSTQSWVTCWVQSRAQLFTSHGRLRGAVTDQTPHCSCKICRITQPGLCVKPWAQAPQAASPLLPGLPVRRTPGLLAQQDMRGHILGGSISKISTDHRTHLHWRPCCCPHALGLSHYVTRRGCGTGTTKSSPTDKADGGKK